MYRTQLDTQMIILNEAEQYINRLENKLSVYNNNHQQYSLNNTIPTSTTTATSFFQTENTSLRTTAAGI